VLIADRKILSTVWHESPFIIDDPSFKEPFLRENSVK
jgi:hypothetical protein